MNAQDIRNSYIKFFADRGHATIPRAPLILKDDPTTLFTGSGMQPLLPYLLGRPHPKGVRLVDSQTCLRAQDIEDVGDNRHTTFFEMLGNFSFGDYFKNEAIVWAWELLTDVLKIDKDRLWVTVYLEDDEAENIWHTKVGIPMEKIVRLGKDDNFWELEVGPSGP